MRKYPHILFFILCLELFILVVGNFTAWPEMVFWPYLMLKGWLPYQNIAIAHTPLMLFGLSLWYKLAGLGLTELKLFTWIVIIVTTSLVFHASGGNRKQKAAITGSLAFAALNFIYEGNGLWFDLLLAPLALGLYLSASKKHYFASGIIFALMLLTKQTAFWFAPVVIFTLLTGDERLPAIKKAAIGFLGTLLVFILVLSLLGILSDFWKWTVEFGVLTLPRSQGQISYPAVRQIIFAILPFSILLFLKKKSLILWALAGAMGAYPRFELFHFQPALPFIALSLSTLPAGKVKHILPSYLLVIFLMFAFVFTKDFRAEARFFDESTLSFSAYLNEKSEDGSAVYIINDWDNIYALSDTVPAINPWIPHLPWYMNDEIQKEIVDDLSIAKPEYIIQRPFEESGLSAFSPPIIMNYIYSHYKQRGTIEGRIIFERQ